MLSQAQDVLRQMGLSEGYHIPIANAENVILEAELQRLILAKAKSSSTLDSLSSRCSGLNKHMKYVGTEQIENQNLLVARSTQLDSEKHMYTLIRMKRETTTNDIRKMANDLIKFDGNKQNKCTNLKSLMSRMDKLKLSVKWDEQTIDSLEESVLKKSTDNEIIKNFSKEDQRKADDLEVKRKRLREEELARRQLVSRVANEIECLQLTLGRNVQMYKQMHDERNSMVRQWQESVKQLQQRNKDTIAVVGETAAVRDMVSANNQALEEQRQFAENERSNNHELSMQISSENGEIVRLRARVNKFMSLVQERTVEISSIQRELRRTAIALEGERADRRHNDQNVEDERIKFSHLISATQKLRDQLNSVLESGSSAVERTRRLEEMVHMEEMNSKTFTYDVERMQGLLFRSQKALVDLSDAFKAKEINQRVQESALVTLQRQIVQVEADSRLSSETIYKLKFRLNMLENRITRTTGDCVDDNSELHQQRRRELEEIMASVSETTSLLQTQIARIEDDMRRMSSSSAADAEVIQSMRDRLQNKLLMVDGAVKQVAQRRSRNNMRRVEQNVLAVRLKGAERSLKREGGVVYGLQRQRMELEAAVRERQAEIAVERELLMVKRRALQDESGRMRFDLQARRIRTEQLKKRLDCILASLGRSEDGEALSVTYFRVRNAQEKYSLQQEGDRLDILIRKAEREIVAMENTLRVVNGTNDSYRKSLNLLEEDADELNEFRRLEELLKQIGSDTRKRNNDLIDRGRIVRTVRASLEEVRAKYLVAVEDQNEKQNKYNLLNNDENDRQAKLDRASAVASVTDCTCGDEYKDMATRQLREVNKSALQQLSETCIRYIETSPVINRYLTEHGITLPFMPLTSRPSASRRASVCSMRSSSSAPSRSDSSGGIPSVILTLNIP